MKKHFWKLSAFLWMCIILYLSFFTAVDPGGLPMFENQDKVGHFIFYAIFTSILIKTFSVELIKNSPIVSAIIFAWLFWRSRRNSSALCNGRPLQKIFGI